MKFFDEIIKPLFKTADEPTSTHSSFRIADSTAVGNNPVRELTLDVVCISPESAIVTLAWKDSAEKILEKKTSPEEASHLSQLLSTDLAQLVKLTDENKYDEAKQVLDNMLKEYSQDSSTPISTNLPKLNVTQAEKDIDEGLWKIAGEVKMQNVFPSGTIQNLTFSSTEDLKAYTDNQKGAQSGKEIPLWEQEGKKAPEDKASLAEPSLSYEDLENQKEEEHENLTKHIDEKIKTELESALQEKAASVFGPEQVELVKVLRKNGRNWDEISQMLIKNFHFNKDAVVIFVDQQRQAAGDEGIEIEKEEIDPLRPPENLVSPETHDKLLEDLKKDKEPVEEEKEIEKVDEAPIVEESAKKSICPECNGEGDVPAVRGGHVVAISCPSCSGDKHIEHTPKELESDLNLIERADNGEIRKQAADIHEHTCSKCDKVWECHKGQACNEGKSALCGKHYSEEEFGKKESSVKVASGISETVKRDVMEVTNSMYRMNAPGAKWYRFSVDGDKIYRGEYSWEDEFGPYQFIYNMETGEYKENPIYKPTAYASLKRAASYMNISETDSIVKVALELWKYPSNYMGDDLSDYYKGPAKGYDADALEKSNFKVALEMLGGEGNGVLIGSFGGFGGSHEQIFVHKDAADKVAILQDIENKMSEYPVLDDSDYSEMQMEEERESYESWAKQEALKIIDQELHRQNPDLQASVSELELSPELEHKLAMVVYEDLSYGDGTALHADHLIQEADREGLLNDFRNALGGKEVVPENPAQMKLFESSLRSKIVKNALKKHAADDVNPLQEPISEEPTMTTPEQDRVPFGQAQHRAPKPESWVVVQSDLKGELPAFRGKFVSEETESDGTKWGIVDRDGELLKVEMHRITPETEGAQTADPIAEPQIEKPQETEIPVTPSLDSLHSASSLKEEASEIYCKDPDCKRKATVRLPEGNFCEKHAPVKKEEKESSQDDLLTIKAEAEQLLKDVEGMGKTSYMFIKKGLEKHANDSAFEGNGWCRVWIQEDEVASSSKYAEALKLPDENARIAALKEIARELAHEALSLADSSASKVGVQSWFDSLSPSDHDRIDWVALANPKSSEDEDLEFEREQMRKYGPEAVHPDFKDQIIPKSSLEPKVEKKADAMDTKCEECGEPLGPEVFLSKWPVCGDCTRKKHKKVTQGSDFEKGISQNKTSDETLPAKPGTKVPSLKDKDIDPYKFHSNLEWEPGDPCKLCKSPVDENCVCTNPECEFCKDRIGQAYAATKPEGSEPDQIDLIMAYEQGDLDEAGILKLFSQLIKSGDAWSLQGSYGRTAKALIDAGYINQNGTIIKDVVDTEIAPEQKMLESSYSFKMQRTAADPPIDPKTRFKELKITPKYVEKDKAVPATPEMSEVFSKIESLEHNLSALETARKQIQAKMKEQLALIDSQGERVQMEEELQESINKAGVLIEALENKVVSWRDKIYVMQNQEVSYVPNVTPKEMLEKIYAKFEGAEKFVESVLNGMKSLAKTVTEKTLVRFPAKKSSLNKESSIIDTWNEELLAALKELSSPL